MREIRNILLIRPSALGDVCRSVPVLASLRRGYPDARIDWLVQKEFGDAVWHHPGLNEAILFDRKGIGRGMKRGKFGALVSLAAKLRRGKYDVVIDAQGLARSAMLGRLSGARVRIGYAAPEAREGAWLWYNRRVRVDVEAHAVARMMKLAEKAGGLAPLEGIVVEEEGGGDEDDFGGMRRDLRLYTGPTERVWAADAIGERRYAVLAPTSRWPGKRWPAARFAALAELILREGGGSVEAVVVVGAGSERDQCGPLLELAGQEPRIVDLIGKTSVGQLMAVIQGAAIVAANDSAALHMAVGFDRPMVGLYGPTRVELVGPYGRERDVIQHVTEEELAAGLDHKDEARGRAMMERISLDEVLGACIAKLGEAGGH